MNGKMRNLLIVLAIVAAVLLAAGFFVMSVLSDFIKMKPAPTGVAAPGIIAIDNRMVNFYVLKSEAGYAVIDTGANNPLTLVELKKAGVDPKKVKTIFLTHSDYDHTAGIGLFPNAKVFISRAEALIISGMVKRSPFFQNKLSGDFVFLDDGNTVNAAGFSVKAILTPGHTLGSVSYLVDGKYLFTGDTLSLKEGSATAFPDFINMDTGLDKNSIRRLASLKGVRMVFTSHSGYSDDPAKVFQNWK